MKTGSAVHTTKIGDLKLGHDLNLMRLMAAWLFEEEQNAEPQLIDRMD